jgi:serine/threonine protein kinase
VHAHNIIHLDLKPENVLLSADNVPWVPLYLPYISPISPLYLPRAVGAPTAASRPSPSNPHSKPLTPNPNPNPNPKPLIPNPNPNPNPNPDPNPDQVTDFGLSTSANLTSQSTSSAGGRGTIYYKAC